MLTFKECMYNKIGRGIIENSSWDAIKVNILAARNRESGNLEIGVPILGNRLFCA